MLVRKQMSSPVGQLTMVASDTGLKALLFEGDLRGHKLYSHAKRVQSHPVLNLCESELKKYFKGSLTEFTVPLEPDGTPFQEKVWSALLQIPYGKTISYRQQALAINNHSAVRAVAAANGKNPIAIIIPCHRVIASTGKLHGYGGGLPLKRKLLEVEGLDIKNDRVTAFAVGSLP